MYQNGGENGNSAFEIVVCKNVLMRFDCWNMVSKRHNISISLVKLWDKCFLWEGHRIGGINYTRFNNRIVFYGDATTPQNSSVRCWIEPWTQCGRLCKVNSRHISVNVYAQKTELWSFNLRRNGIWLVDWFGFPQTDTSEPVFDFGETFFSVSFFLRSCRPFE